MKRLTSNLLIVMAIAIAAAPSAIAREPDQEGVKVGRAAISRHFYPASWMENTGTQQFTVVKQQASRRGALLPQNHPQTERLRRIHAEMLPFVEKWNPRTKDWKWDVQLINSPNINAFCMPGGKIAFFTGILEKLRLTDDEVAMVMGHEIAHALREHSRARAVKSTFTNLAGRIVGAYLFGQAGEQIGAQTAGLLSLKFSRNDETDADLVGMELAARAGYNPAAGITLWQKMSKAAGGAPPQWLSTHPAGETRIKLIQDNLKDVNGLYERARLAKAGGAGLPSPTPGAGPPPSSIPLPAPGSGSVPNIGPRPQPTISPGARN